MLEATAADTANDETSIVCKAIINSPDDIRRSILPYASIVGAWVWIEFPEKPNADIRAFLKELGFRWNKTRGVWQNPCGVFRRRTNGNPRLVYGEIPLLEED